MKVIFLDRDGVINKSPGDKKYVTKLKNFYLLPGVTKQIANLSNNGFKIFVISNQAGVGKGLYTQKTLDLITAKMLSQIEKVGGKIAGVYYCTHRPEDDCLCRKPKAGLIKNAQKKHKLNLKNSFFIGDTIRDVLTAHKAGCKSILVLTGKEKISNRNNWQAQPDFVFKNLKEATQFILNKK